VVPRVLVVGGGLAGSEAAWQLACAGVEVTLAEMRPTRSTPAHTSDRLAELVCSNSLRAASLENAVGLLKHEMAELGSLLIRCAREHAVPAGGALAVDRERFADAVTAAVAGHPRIVVERRQVADLPAGPAVLATGPLTAPALEQAWVGLLGEGALGFWDAVAPIVAADSLDPSQLFRGSRYGKGGGADYLNLPLDRAQYEQFVAAVLAADKVPLREFEGEQIRHFEGCLPIEVMAERGVETLRWGPMKPVGLLDPRTGRRPWAVVQLRQDDLAADHWNMVGFQTKLTAAEQARVFRTLPGMATARFVRYGTVHRNTFINAPRHLDRLLRLRVRPDLWVAGQLSGVEGYVESAATGLIVARNLAAALTGGSPSPPPPTTALGGLVRHLTERDPHGYQPANISWGLLVCPDLLRAVRSRAERRARQAALALEEVRRWAAGLGERPSPAAGAAASA
jgi:methylenetetrahydrofolate--tRNA-(uracil-5-)-methyltransferase